MRLHDGGTMGVNITKNTTNTPNQAEKILTVENAVEYIANHPQAR